VSAAALRELPLAVVVVAAAEDDATSCATSTASYVSLRPPMLCVPLRPDSRTAQMIGRTGRFSVSVLAAGQADLAQRAGQRAAGRDKIVEIGAKRELSPTAPADPPGIGGAAAVLWCAVREIVTAGDHRVIFGEVTGARGAAPGSPLLLRHHRRYLGTGEPLSPYAPEGYPI
jgi:3-hydroxy-9,10-secoandrosta-1,3,5(10)-triene-9,17-dione monooxygenase reductase component